MSGGGVTQVTGHTDDAPLSRYHWGMLRLVEKIADAAITRGVWDEDPPAVWCVVRSRTTLGLPSLAAHEMPLDEQVWGTHGGDGAQTIAHIAEHLAPAMRQRRKPAREVDAVAFCGEGWTLRYPDDVTDEQVEQAALFAQVRGTADHPWAVEAKAVTAVGADGWCYNVTRHRDTGAGSALAEPPDGGFTGRYPEALAALLAAMRAHS